MNARTAFKWILACGLLVTVFAGCDKLTRKNFDMITPNVDGKFDVEKMIGEPDDKLDDQWLYERIDKHLNVFVHFNDDDIVIRKEWHDTLNNEHYDSNPPSDDSSSYESTTIRKFNQ